MKMRSRTIPTVLVIPLVLSTISGCMSDMLYPTMGDVKEFTSLGSQQLKAHDDNMTKQHISMHPEAERAILAHRAIFEKEIGRIDEETKALKSKQGELIAMLIKLGGEVAGLPPIITNAITRDLRPDIDTAKAEAKEAENAAETAARAAEVAKEAADNIQHMLAKLDTDTRDKLAAIDTNTLRKLKEAKEDREKFEEILEKDAKFTATQLADLKGMSTEQILALIAAAAGAAGIGIVGGKGGKSRSAGEVEKLREDIGDLAKDIERAKPPLT